MFVIGDKVKWTSSNVAKFGEVVAVVPAGMTPAQVGHPKAGGGGMPRKDESYIVHGRKLDSSRRTYGSKGYYWPVNSLLAKEV